MPFIISLILAVVLLLSSAAAVAQNTATQDEIQVLIDVSGSMKQNDPANQRVDAVQLLINLLPEGAKVSFWLFAEQTTLLSETSSVNNEWRQTALKASEKIHSRGQRTHIERAIQTALEKGFHGEQRKHLIVLTDGMVDIDPDIMVSADSRERVLSELIPQLKQHNIKVETVALSDQADKALLQALAVETDGWMESALSAEQLQRTFFKMAQKAAPKPTVPISTNNQFLVDSGIKEFSVLVFKKPKAPPTELITPDQKKLNKKVFSTTMFWLENAGYDLITVRDPMPGTWQINAEADPDNQVMILTDLKMNINELPNFVDVKQHLEIKAHFTDHDRLITRDDFLNLITFTLAIDHHSETALQAVHGETGYFNAHLTDLKPGKHLLTLVADSKTFKREVLREIEVIASPLEVETEVDEEHRTVAIEIKPNAEVVDLATLSINLHIKNGEQIVQKTVPRENEHWHVQLEPHVAHTTTEVTFHIAAKRKDGTPITPEADALEIDDSWFGEVEEEHHDEEAQPEDEEHIEAEPVHWVLVSAIVLVFNGLFLGIGYGVYSWIDKKNRQQEQQLLEKLA